MVNAPKHQLHPSGPVQPEQFEQPADPDEGARQWRWAAAGVTVSAVGVLVVALGYTLARLKTDGALLPFWVGQFLIFAPIAVFAVVVRRPSGRVAAMLSVALGLATYVVKICYSPTRLTFHDELQHRAGLVLALHNHSLTGTNPSLPIATDFPGTAALGSAFASLTGLPVDASAMIITGVAKVALGLSILLVVAELSSSYRLGLLGVLLYAANGNFEIFSSFYVYQTFALPFAFVAIYCAIALRKQGHAVMPVLLAGIVSVALTVVTHHIAALFVAGALVVAAFWTVVRRRPRPWPMLVLTGFSIVFTAVWFSLVATGVGSYIKPYYELSDPVVNQEVPIPVFDVHTQRAPGPDQFFNRVGLALIVILAVVGLVLMVFRRATTEWSRPWRFTFVLTTIALVGSAAIAATRPYGNQGATRALVFTFIGAAVFGAAALVWLTGLRQRRTASTLGVVAILLCIVGGLEFGWPPWWEKLPGSYKPFGYESGVDPQVLTATTWVRDNLAPGSRITGDANAMTAVSTLTSLVTAREAVPIFYDRTISTGDAKVIANNRVRYLWTDTRVARTLSPSNRYYSGGLGVQYTNPPPLAGLTKWAKLPEISEVYKSGTITIYDLAGTSLDD